MKYRVLTVAREFGSGGAEVARQAAERLGWRLLDNALVVEVGRRAQVEPELARLYDERVDTWLHRVARKALWHGGFQAVAEIGETDVFDSETMARLATNLVREAYEQGDCVIVGRGAQCVLQEPEDVFHVFVYAPRGQKLERLRRRLPDVKDHAAYMHAMDLQRAGYVERYFGGDWANPHLYQLMVNSELGVDAAVGCILTAMGAE